MTPDTFRNALVLTGPTGSGKSALALELAERTGAEIVSMDSMTLYRGLDVGTAKPTADDRRRVLVPGLYVRPSTATTGRAMPWINCVTADRIQSLWV